MRTKALIVKNLGVLVVEEILWQILKKTSEIERKLNKVQKENSIKKCIKKRFVNECSFAWVNSFKTLLIRLDSIIFHG